MVDKPVNDTTNNSEQVQAQLKNTSDTSLLGRLGKSGPEPYAIYDPAQREKIITQDDSHIVLGGDRISSKASGYGGKGHSSAHMIDLVVGRDPHMSGDPSFKGDAARVYISQRTDIDAPFGLVAGNVGNPKGRSGVSVAADGIRLVAKEGIKLVTMSKGEDNSLGTTMGTYSGINLIAGNNDTELEPFAKAYKVADTFEVVIDAIEDLSGMVENFITVQSTLNMAMAAHFHPPFAAPDTILATACGTAAIQTQVIAKMPLRSHRLKCLQLRLNHLNPAVDAWLGSRWNFTN